MGPASVFSSKAQSLECALARRTAEDLFWTILPPVCHPGVAVLWFCPLVCVKILSVVLDLHPPLTYGDLGFLLGGFAWCHEAEMAAKLTPWRLSPAELFIVQSLAPLTASQAV